MDVISTSDRIGAHMVWDGAGDPTIPAPLLPQCDSPMLAIHEAGQFQGSPLDRVCEIAGRACYDSFGRGRDSLAYHRHIREVRHNSVYRHVNLTFNFPFDSAPTLNPFEIVTALACRPGVLVTGVDRRGVRATVSLQSAIEWDLWTSRHPFLFFETVESAQCEELMGEIGRTVLSIYHAQAPFVVDDPDDYVNDGRIRRYEPHLANASLVSPEAKEEKWITLLLTGSRGFSHELVRHTYRTAPSQRSTRYVDETDSPWVRHPLADAYYREAGSPFQLEVPDDSPHNCVEELVGRGIYAPMVDNLQSWLKAKGADNQTARKQARGAARGYLGNALYTEVVFSASVQEWLCMLRQRASGPADAEIREVFCKALPVLRSSQYGSEFEHLELRPAPDGIGQVVVGQGEAEA